jgi:hypothetical protein
VLLSNTIPTGAIRADRHAGAHIGGALSIPRFALRKELPASEAIPYIVVQVRIESPRELADARLHVYVAMANFRGPR